MNIKDKQAIPALWNFWAKLFQKVGITLLSLGCIKIDTNQTFSLLKSMMQYCRAIFSYSVIFMVKKGMQKQGRLKHAF